MAVLNGFVKSIAWSDLVPSGLNGMKTLVTSGGGTVTGSDYIAAAATPTGTLLVAYIPPDNTSRITVDMTAMGATAQARWYDPTAGTYTAIPGSFPNTGTRDFVPPGNNSSGYSDWVLVLDASSAPDTLGPSAPTGLSAVGGFGSVSLTWNAATDNIGVVAYDVYRSAVANFTPSLANRIAQSLGPGYVDTASPGTYYYLVGARDAAGNIGPASNQAVAIVEGDTQAPTIPTDLQASNVGTDSVRLSWTASTDNSGNGVGYRIIRDSVVKNTTTATSFVDVGLSASTAYMYSVAAFDAVNNVSAPSTPLVVTTASVQSASPAFVQLKEATTSDNSRSISTGNFASVVSGGNLVVAWIWYNSSSQSVASVIDSSGSAYVRAVGPTTGTGSMAAWRQELWYTPNAVGGSRLNVTATFTGAFNAEKSITAHEYSGLDQVSPLDATAVWVGSSANSSTSSFSTSSAPN